MKTLCFKLFILFFICFFSFIKLSYCANPYFLNKKGIENYNKSKFSTSLNYFNRAYKTDKKDEYLFNKGDVLIKLKRYKDAENIFKKITDSNLKSKAFYNLGIIKYREKKFNEALNFFKKATLLNPSDLQARINYELIMKKMDKKNRNKKNNNKNSSNKKNKKNEKDKKREKQTIKPDENLNKRKKSFQEKRNREKQGKVDKKILNLYNEKSKLLKEIIRKQFHFKYRKPDKDW